MGWITDTRYTSLAANDDASSSTLDSHITYRVPDGVASRAYRIVFRSYDRADASFAVRLSIRAGEHAACEYAGNTYEYGERFPSTDGCNTCSCRTGGVTCTEKACACDPDHEPNRNYLGTPTSCQSIRYRCPSGTRSFQNACGCGCELL
jgi:hypothetical protein